MANQAAMDGVFLALADPTRREVLHVLRDGPSTVGELSRSFDITLPSFLKHIRTLESNGLIRTRKSGRVRTCALNPSGLNAVSDWLNEQREAWESRTDRLEAVAREQSSSKERE